MKKTVLLYGGQGLLGSEIKKQFEKKYTLLAPTHTEIDVTQKTEVNSHIAASKPDYIVYTVGVSRIDQAEQQPEMAYTLNASTPEMLAKIARNKGIPFIYISSDAVFDGSELKRPFKETDLPKPVTTYGKSKLLGEQAVISLSENNVVLRVVMLYSAFHAKKQDFARFVVKSLREGKPISGVIDQYISPLFVPTATKALHAILQNNVRGIYHLASTNTLSNYDFIKILAKTFGFDEKLILPVTLTDFLKNKPVHRATYACLDTEKFQTEFGQNILQPVEKDLMRFKIGLDLPHNAS